MIEGYQDISDQLVELTDRLHMLERHAFTDEWRANFDIWSGHIHETLSQHVESLINQMLLNPMTFSGMERRLSLLELRLLRIMHSGRFIPPLPANAVAVRDALLRDALRTRFDDRLSTSSQPDEQYGVTADSTRSTVLEEITATERSILTARFDELEERVRDMEMRELEEHLLTESSPQYLLLNRLTPLL